MTWEQTSSWGVALQPEPPEVVMGEKGVQWAASREHTPNPLASQIPLYCHLHPRQKFQQGYSCNYCETSID